MTKTRRNIIALCFLVSFLSLAAAGFLTLRRYTRFPFDPHILTQVRADEVTKELLPIQLVIPDQRIDLPIIPAQLQNQEWQLSNQGVSLLQTPLPIGKERGLILYGHNWKSLLGDLHKTEIGQKISVQYPDGNIDHYSVQSIFTVSPSRLDVLDLAQPDTLLIYTCTGFLDSQRLVILAHR